LLDGGTSLQLLLHPFAASLATSPINCTVASNPPHLQTGIELQYTALVVLMAIGVNLISAVGRLKLTNIEKMRRYTAEMKAFRSELNAAMKEGNKQKQEKLKKKQQQMQKMQAEMSMENLKPGLLFALPFFGLYYLMVQFLAPHVCALAISPITIPLVVTTIPVVMPFFWWYMICSFTFSTIITRLLGLTFD
jgi:uncharacterized membrane protein (DUF106 family)